MSLEEHLNNCLLQKIYKSCKYFFRRFPDLRWIIVEHFALQDYIIGFNKVAVRFFKNYPASRMITTKFHALDHVVDALRAVSLIDHLHAAKLEGSQKQFKSKYDKTSKRIDFAMNEVITRINLGTMSETRNCQSFCPGTPFISTTSF